MEPIASLQPFGLMSMLLMAVTAGFILARRPVDAPRSISMHVADQRHTFLLFAVISTVCIGLFGTFMWGWFAPALQLPTAFLVLVVLAQLCQFVAAWVPHTAGRKGDIHGIFAYTMAVLMPVLLVFVLFSSAVPVVGKLIVGAATAWLIASLYRLVFMPHLRQQYLLHQSVYIGVFFVAILAATYLAQVVPALPSSSAGPQVIHLQADDLQDDPHLQSAVQKLQQQTSPQPTYNDSNVLQPVTQGVPTE